MSSFRCQIAVQSAHHSRYDLYAMKNSRAIAAKLLSDVLVHSHSLNQGFLRAKITEHPEQSFIKDLCYGSCRYFYELNTLVTASLKKPLKRKDSDILCLLIIGLYQLRYSQKPPYAIVNETTKACQALKKPWAKGLLNALLRAYSADKANQLIANNLEAKYNHPMWLIDKLKTQYPDDWETILTSNMHHPAFTLRINTQKTNQQDYLEQLDKHGIAAEADSDCQSSITLKNPCDPRELPGFDSGLVSVQDTSSQLAVPLLDLQPGQRVLDVCCAPGGKTLQILQTWDSLKVTAIDIDETRIKRVFENLERANCTAKVIVADALAIDDWWDGQAFDRILLDAPCSALGVIKRHPDIKLLRTHEQVAAITDVQQQLLKTLLKCLSPDGKLVYSVCSMLEEESNHPLPSRYHYAYQRTVLPTALQDGFSYAVITKK